MIFPFFTHFPPFFTHLFPFFYAFFPLFFAFLCFLLKDKGKQQQFTAKMGNFTPTPSAPTPCKTSRVFQLPREWGTETGVITKEVFSRTFLKRPLFQKTPFSDPERRGAIQALSDGGASNGGYVFQICSVTSK